MGYRCMDLHELEVATLIKAFNHVKPHDPLATRGDRSVKMTNLWMNTESRKWKQI